MRSLSLVTGVRSGLNVLFELLASVDAPQMVRAAHYKALRNDTAPNVVRLLHAAFGAEPPPLPKCRPQATKDAGGEIAVTLLQCEREGVLLDRCRIGGPVTDIANAVGRQVRDKCGTATTYSGVVIGVGELDGCLQARAAFTDGTLVDYTLEELRRVLVTAPVQPLQFVLIPFAYAGRWFHNDDRPVRVRRYQWYGTAMALCMFSLRTTFGLRSGDLSATQGARRRLGVRRRAGRAAADEAAATPLAAADVIFDAAGMSIQLQGPKEAWLRSGGVAKNARSVRLRADYSATDLPGCAIAAAKRVRKAQQGWTVSADARGNVAFCVRPRGTHPPYSSDRTSNLQRNLMIRAGVDCAAAQLHPSLIRGFAATLWLQAGYTSDAVRYRCRWLNADTLERHYRKTMVPCAPERSFLRALSWAENLYREARDRAAWRVELIIGGRTGQVVAYVEPSTQAQERRFKFVAKSHTSVESRAVVQRALEAARVKAAAGREHGPALASN